MEQLLRFNIHHAVLQHVGKKTRYEKGDDNTHQQPSLEGFRYMLIFQLVFDPIP